ncbi:MAG: cobalt transport protein [Clostridia bacterium]|nr:cobalt transport protein [Clostridia bacterium]
MRSFKEFNPTAVFIWYAAVLVITMFFSDPIIVSLSFLSAVSLMISLSGKKEIKPVLLFLLLVPVMAVINPIFNHRGETVLFVINDNPVTFEAFFYGMYSAFMIVTVLCLIRSFTKIMTSDRLLYLFGSFSPKMALILSMALRYIPLYGKVASSTARTQKALGLDIDDSIPGRIRGGTRVFSVMVTWALENGIITADSMAARGYGIKRRTFFSVYRFRKYDFILVALSLLLSAAVIVSAATKTIDFNYYPKITGSGTGFLTTATYIVYTVMVMIPIFIETEVGLKWKYLKSKI